MENCPLYTGEYCGSIYDKNRDIDYRMVIITKWTDRTKFAKEINHRTYYFDGTSSEIKKELESEEFCEFIYNNFKQYSRIRKEVKWTNV